MEYLCFFALGMLAVTVGVVLGIFMGRREARPAEQMEKKVGEPERTQMLEEQKAFHRLLCYNTDQAYGLVGKEDEEL